MTGLPDDSPATSPVVAAAAGRVLAYLAQADPAPASPVDAVIGFGVFDLSLPRFCADLYANGRARHLIFTGGIGAGTGSLGGPEADMWREEVRRSHPHLPDRAFILENRSTNTAENIRFTAELLRHHHPELTFGEGLNTAILIASPSRLRRVRLTLRQLEPAVRAFGLVPSTDLAAEEALYARHGVNYLSHLVGELDRITTYPLRGWIAAEPLPPSIVEAGEILRAVTRGQSR